MWSSRRNLFLLSWEASWQVAELTVWTWIQIKSRKYLQVAKHPNKSYQTSKCQMLQDLSLEVNLLRLVNLPKHMLSSMIFQRRIYIKDLSNKSRMSKMERESVNKRFQLDQHVSLLVWGVTLTSLRTCLASREKSQWRKMKCIRTTELSMEGPPQQLIEQTTWATQHRHSRRL